MKNMSRRDFVKVMGVAVGSAALTGITSEAKAEAGSEDIFADAGNNNRPELAQNAYLSNATCAQAVFSVYAKYLGIDQETGNRMMEAFGGGIAGRQEACGAFVAAVAVLSYLGSNGRFEYGETRNKNFANVREMATKMAEKYGGVKCIDVLKGAKPQAGHCGDTVYNVAAMLEESLSKLAE